MPAMTPALKNPAAASTTQGTIAVKNTAPYVAPARKAPPALARAKSASNGTRAIHAATSWP